MIKGRHKMIPLFLAAALITCICTSCSDKTASNEDEGIHAEYEEALFEKGRLNDIQISMENWDDFFEQTMTKEYSWMDELVSKTPKEYDACNVIINGEEVDNVGIRAKGILTLRTAANTEYNKFSLVLKFNKFTDKQKYHDLRMLDLNSNLFDATSMKDAVTYDMCRYIGLPAPLCNYAKVSVNGEYYGCYLAVEPVDKDFCKRNFGKDYGSLYKALHNLNYEPLGLHRYKYIKDMVKIQNSSFSSVKSALKSVHKKRDMDEHVDIDAVLKYMAVQTMVVNMDGLTGDITHNYYLYESDGKISLIPWDYDMAFGGMLRSDDEMFSRRMELMSEGNFDKEEWEKERELAYKEEIQTLVNLPVDTPFVVDLSEREFFMNLLSNNEYSKKYHDYLSVLAEEYVQGGELDNTIKYYTDEIEEIVGTEENSYYKHDDFAPAVEQLRMFLEKKSESVIGQLNGSIPSDRDGQAEAPETLIDTSDLDVRVMGEMWYHV